MAHMEAHEKPEADDTSPDASSGEAEELENLIERLVEREASEEDVARLRALSSNQARRLRPAAPVPPPPVVLRWSGRKRA